MATSSRASDTDCKEAILAALDVGKDVRERFTTEEEDGSDERVGGGYGGVRDAPGRGFRFDGGDVGGDSFLGSLGTDELANFASGGGVGCFYGFH